MKRSLFLIMLCAYMGSYGQNLYMNEKSGTSTSYSITNINKITFQNNDVVIETKTASNNYTISGTRSITFEALITSIDGPVSVLKGTSIYPNPCNDVLNIKDIPENASFFIYDMNGSLILNDKANASISLSQLSTGVYFITLVANNTTNTLKFIKK